MTGIEWLIVMAVAFGVAWVAVWVTDERAERRALPPVPQPVQAHPPLLPPTREVVQPTWGRVDYVPPGPGRHRRPVKGESA